MPETPERQPLIYGLEAGVIPDGYVALEAIAVVKCIDDDGEMCLLARRTPGMTTWDAIGLATAGLDIWRDMCRQGFIPDPPEDDADA